jgi:molecular chaperone HtpG
MATDRPFAIVDRALSSRVPYRSSRVGIPKRSAEPGIVDGMVRQFADRYAFLRELVQNGIDAGATRIEVRIERDSGGSVTTSIDDDGCGMTRAIIEGPLLTLLSSSKEDDTTKIGKYGIGFVSVFAVEPEQVDVRTCRDGEGWLVRLFGDHSYELMEDRSREQGTVVSLVQTMTSEQFGVHADLATAALRRWCRHARVPVAVSIFDADDPSSAQPLTINAPMTVPGLVTVSHEVDAERFVVGVGRPTALGIEAEKGGGDASPSFAGFYNRGLMLFETSTPEADLEQVRFKIDSPRLAHTLSRDNVRRDAQLRRVLRIVGELVRGELLRVLLERIAIAAASGAVEEWAALLEAACANALRFARDKGELVARSSTRSTARRCRSGGCGGPRAAPSLSPIPRRRSLVRSRRKAIPSFAMSLRLPRRGRTSVIATSSSRSKHSRMPLR